MMLSPRIGVVAALVAVALLLASTLGSVAQFWLEMPDYAHGWLISAIAIGWCARVLWRHPLPVPDSGALLRALPLGCALFMWLVATNAHSQIGAQLLLPVVLLAAVYAIAGAAMAVRLAPPLGFLYFAIPVWDYALPLLQRASVFVTERALALLRVPAEVSDYTVRIPAGTFQIVEGCSGKRYFMVALALGVLAAALNGLGLRRGLVLVMGAAVLALLANYVRIVLVIYAGHVTAMQHHWVAVEHKTLGNVIFGILIATIIMLGRVLVRRGGDERRQESHAAVPASNGPWARLPWTAVAPTALLLGAAALLVVAKPGQRGAVAPLGALPVLASSWAGPLPADPAWRPRYVGADEELRARYRNDTGAIELYVNRYHAQSRGSELIHYGNSLHAPGSWSVPWSTEAQRTTTDPPLVLAEVQDAESKRWVIAHVYDIAAISTTSDAWAQWLYGILATFGPAPAGVTALAARCEGQDCDDARARVMSFWNDMGRALTGLRHGAAD